MMYQYKVIIDRIVDGDTVDVDIDLGFDTWIKKSRIRLYGIDAPEVRTRDLNEKEEGFKAKAFLEMFLPVGSTQLLISKEYNRGKYGRILGDFEIYFAPQDRYCNLTDLLLEKGLAEIYNG